MSRREPWKDPSTTRTTRTYNRTHRQKRDEVTDLKAKLRNPEIERDPAKKREYLKRAIGYMTQGIDTSPLFSEMIMAAATTDLVQKKMVYLYLAAHAESNSDVAILAINTLQKDCKDESPLVRGLALRAMASLKLSNIIEYLVPLLRAGLADNSPYVRKTAIIGSCKLWRINVDAFKGMGMIDKLYAMVRDPDPLVSYNAIIVLNEVLAEEGGMAVSKNLMYFLLNRLRELSEWQQCLILNMLLKYVPETDNEIFDIMNLLEERLRGSNSAVILATTNVFLHLTQNVPDVHRQVYHRLREPLLTLASTSHVETAYACLCHIKLLIAREPAVFASAYKDFYIRYTDPQYMRTLKLAILVAIANESNMRDIVEELSEYATDLLAETARGAIRSLGQIALKLPGAVNECLKHFLEFLESDQSHIRAETFALLKDVVRRYRNINHLRPFFKSILDNWRFMEDKESKVSIIWILGEYGEDVDDAPYILEYYVNHFLEQPPAVRIELLTACMKLFFKRPPEMQPILGTVLDVAVSDFSHADVHDRALLYYRLLVKDPNTACRVVTGSKEPIAKFTDGESAEITDKLFEEFNTLSVIYGMPAERFTVKRTGVLGLEEEKEEEAEPEEEEEPEDQANTIMEEQLLSEPDEPNVQDDQLILDISATIEPSTFQQKWGTLSTSETVRLQLRTPVPEADAIERALGDRRILCLASGVQQGVQKFYFYAQSDSSTAQHLLCETTIDGQGSMTTVVKGDDPQFTQFIAYLKGAFRPFI